MDTFKDKLPQNCHSHWHIFCGMLVVFLAVLIVFTGASLYNKIKESKYIGQEIESRNTITVSDSGEVYTKPDLALVTFSVVKEAKTVSQAMADNSKSMDAVINAIKELGVEDKDLKTTNFNIYPRYNYSSSGQRTLIGYEVSQSLQVKIRDLAKVSQIIQGATEVGANQMSDLIFTVDEQDELKNQAREEAIKKVKEKAKKIADQLGVDLVRIINFNESSQSPMYYDYAAREYGIGGGGGAPEIETGENKIEVMVSITYEIE